MAYQALYRKYRPKDFSSVKGQDHIVKTLGNELQSNRIGHAYLFCGTRGTGKTTVAKIFAKAVNCENPGPNGPCGECSMCRSIEEQTSMNVVEMDAASHNGVDDVRTLIDEIQYSPAEGKYKVYIIDEVHMLSTSAFNALLKTLEEPPSYVIFILATTEYHKIPITILSRCQRYDFKRISVDMIADRLGELLDKEGVEAEPKALQYVARQADGALRDGLSLIEQCVSFYFGEKLTYDKVLKVLGAVDQDVYLELLEHLIHGGVNGAVDVVARLVEQGKDLRQFVEEFIWFLRNAMVIGTAEEPAELVDLPEDVLTRVDELVADCSMDVIFRYIRILSELGNALRYSTNKRVDLEVALIKLCRPQMENDYDALINRIQNMEQMNQDLQVALESGTLSFSGEKKAEPVKPAKEIRPEAVPEDVREAVANWKTIMSRVNPVAQTMLREVRVSVSEEGAMILAFSHPTEAQYFKNPANQEQFIDVVGQIIGKEIRLDVRLTQNATEMNALPDLCKIIKGVDIEIVD